MAAEAAGAALVVMVAAVRDLHGAKRYEERGQLDQTNWSSWPFDF